VSNLRHLRTKTLFIRKQLVNTKLFKIKCECSSKKEHNVQRARLNFRHATRHGKLSLQRCNRLRILVASHCLHDVLQNARIQCCVRFGISPVKHQVRCGPICCMLLTIVSDNCFHRQFIPLPRRIFLQSSPYL
jgi:hypothetical protein